MEVTPRGQEKGRPVARPGQEPSAGTEWRVREIQTEWPCIEVLVDTVLWECSLRRPGHRKSTLSLLRTFTNLDHSQPFLYQERQAMTVSTWRFSVEKPFLEGVQRSFVYPEDVPRGTQARLAPSSICVRQTQCSE